MTLEKNDRGLNENNVNLESSSQGVEKIKETLRGLTMLEVSKLVKDLEQEYGVSAVATNVSVPSSAELSGDVEDVQKEEKTLFNVVIKDVGGKKIQVIKEVKGLCVGMGLKEVKELVESDNPIKEGVSLDEANQIKEKLEKAGATVELI